MRSVACAAAILPVILLLGWASSAEATIVKIPLGDMVIGSEVTSSTLAPNGEFESHHGFDVRYPNYWNSFNDQVITAAPINVPAGYESYFGGYAFQAQSVRLD